ncbi:MAG TPA: hypothetical protein PLZ95_21300 [Bryobacteraceae bacterium]|nr:hypothetical protein [Bryobacteraceae bacterium]
MPTEPEALGKRWQQAKICAELSIAFVGLIFTIVYGYQALVHNHLSWKMQRLQTVATWIPLLTSDRPEIRGLARGFIVKLEKDFALEILPIIAVSEPVSELRIQAATQLSAIAVSDSDVTARSKASVGLKSIAQDASGDAQKVAQKGVALIGLRAELERQKLFTQLQDAHAYAGARSMDGTRTAVNLYRDVFSKLSTSGRQALDATLISRAGEAQSKNDAEAELSAYEALFKDLWAAEMSKADRQ